MNRCVPFAASISLVIIATVAGGCSATVRSVFHPSDPSFTPTAGARPPVYLHARDVPKVGMRSVGVVKVTVPGSSGIAGAIDAAAAKGQQIGCSMLIEHGTFGELGPRAVLGYGASVILAHGGGGGDAPDAHGPQGSSDSSSLTAEFDCVIEVEPGTAAQQTAA